MFGFMEGENVGVGKGSVRGMESWYARGMWHRFGEKAGRQRERISVRAVAEEGGYNLGPGRGRYCGRVSCLSQRRVLALPQWF